MSIERSSTKYDAVIVGAGIGGLVCGTKLAQGGAQVLICEAMPYPGGYMATYRRRGFRFACGALSFSSPERVDSILAGLGLAGSVHYLRSHFRLLTPAMDVVISQPFADLAACLGKLYPHEARGIEAFFAEVQRIASATSGRESWEPRLLHGSAKEEAELKLAAEHADYVSCLQEYGKASSRDLAARFVSDDELISLLGRQGTEGSCMPAMLATTMWDILCETGIWYPDCGIQGVTDLLVERFLALGGELKLRTRVSHIICHVGRAVAVRLADGQDLAAGSVISNADYKTTFLSMVEGARLPPGFVRHVHESESTGSDLCVSLGTQLTENDLADLQTHHVLYRGLLRPPEDWEADSEGPDFFRRRQVEICTWSLLDASLAPPGKHVVILRCRAPYEHFARWVEPGTRERRPGYRAYAEGLAQALILAAEDVIPNLAQKTEVIDVATPLTYEYYTGNHRGAVAGWSWAADRTVAPIPELLASTPVRALYAVGHWAFTAPFLGAVPTAMHSGELVAQAILSGDW